ncbi:hypothetical protein [Sphingomonas sp.]|jgi:hypothetical protein|uniref:hypothetical protein n=1 Tax=Sphingomonas sp. TaxID=28214 RepID=UPI00356A0E4D
MPMEPQVVDDLYADANLGIEMEQFEHHNVGKYLTARARQEIKDFNNWCCTPGSEPAEFAQKRIPAVAAVMALAWIKEAIANGRNAQIILEQRNDN